MVGAQAAVGLGDLDPAVIIFDVDGAVGMPGIGADQDRPALGRDLRARRSGEACNKRRAAAKTR